MGILLAGFASFALFPLFLFSLVRGCLTECPKPLLFLLDTGHRKPLSLQSASRRASAVLLSSKVRCPGAYKNVGPEAANRYFTLSLLVSTSIATHVRNWILLILVTTTFENSCFRDQLRLRWALSALNPFRVGLLQTAAVTMRSSASSSKLSFVKVLLVFSFLIFLIVQ